MSSVDELMELAYELASLRADFVISGVSSEAEKAEEALRTALTTAIEGYEARIAELEAQATHDAGRVAELVGRTADLYDENAKLKIDVSDFESSLAYLNQRDDEQAFLDAAAIALSASSVRLHENENLVEHVSPKWAFDAAHALLAERRKRMVQP